MKEVKPFFFFWDKPHKQIELSGFRLNQYISNFEFIRLGYLKFGLKEVASLLTCMGLRLDWLNLTF